MGTTWRINILRVFFFYLFSGRADVSKTRQNTSLSNSPFANCKNELRFQLSNIVQITEARRVHIIHYQDDYVSNCLLKLMHLNWIGKIQMSAQRFSNTSLDFDYTPFQLILIWIERFEQLADYTFLSIEKKVLIFVFKETRGTANPVHDLDLPVLQDLIIWRQNNVYLFTYSEDSTSTVPNFSLQLLKHEFDGNIFQITNLEINCMEQQKCQFEKITKRTLFLEKHNFTISQVVRKEIFGFHLKLFEILDHVLEKFSNISSIVNITIKHDYNILTNLKKKQYDIVRTLFGMSTERVLNFDFVNSPIVRDTFAFVMRQDSVIKEYLWLTFFKPFSMVVWLCILATYLIIALSVASITQNHKSKPSTSAYTVTGTEKLFRLLIISSYSVVLYASLTVTTSRLQHNSIQDVLLDDRVNLYAYGLLFTYKLIKNAETNLTREIWHRMEKSPGEGNISFTDAPKLLSKNKNAIIDLYNILKQKYGQNCSLSFIKIPMGDISSYFMFNKKSKHVELFNQNILNLNEKGIVKRLDDKYKTSTFCQTRNYDCKPISIYHTITAFLILIGGVFCSGIIFLLEFFYWNKFENDSVRTNPNPTVIVATESV